MNKQSFLLVHIFRVPCILKRFLVLKIKDYENTRWFLRYFVKTWEHYCKIFFAAKNVQADQVQPYHRQVKTVQFQTLYLPVYLVTTTVFFLIKDKPSF